MGRLDDIKNKAAGAVVKMPSVQNALNDSIRDMLRMNKIDDTKQLDIISDIIKTYNADICMKNSIYLTIFEAEGIDKHIFNYLNDSGYLNGTLSFFRKYINVNTCQKLLNSKARKVISNNIVYVTDKNVKVKEGEEKEALEIKIKRKLWLNRVQQFMDAYGECLLFVNEIGDNPNEIKAKVIEPFRYIRETTTDDNGKEIEIKTVIYTYLRTTEEETIVYNKKEIIEDLIAKTSIIKTTDKRIERDKNGEITVRSETPKQEPEIAFLVTHLYTNDEEGNNNIDLIKPDMTMNDVTNSHLAMEIKLSAMSIHMSDGYFENGQVLVNGYYKIYPEALGDDKRLFEPYQPAIRDDSYNNIKNGYVSSIAVGFGMSPRSVGLYIANTNYYKTATSDDIEDDQTRETINEAKDLLAEQVNMMLESLYKGYVIDLKTATSQNLSKKADILAKVDDKMSVEQQTLILFPTMNEKERTKEILLVKLENGKYMTPDEIDLAKKIGLMNDNSLTDE